MAMNVACALANATLHSSSFPSQSSLCPATTTAIFANHHHFHHTIILSSLSSCWKKLMLMIHYVSFFCLTSWKKFSSVMPWWYIVSQLRSNFTCARLYAATTNDKNCKKKYVFQFHRCECCMCYFKPICQFANLHGFMTLTLQNWLGWGSNSSGKF